jgi:hypothetical protein
VAEVLQTSWSPTFGVIEALYDVTRYDLMTRIVCERHLMESGIDVFWNDLVCSTKEQAFAAVSAVAGNGVNLEALYGPSYDAILGILQWSVRMTADDIAALGYQLGGYGSGDYDKAYIIARNMNCERLMDRVLSDVEVASVKASVASPSHVQRHLRGVRAIEMSAMYHVLVGAGITSESGDYVWDFMLRLTQPMRDYLFPNAPSI